MIEIIGILLQLFIFLTIFCFPFQPRSLNNFFNLKVNTLNYIDSHAINLIFFIFLATFFSFSNIDLKILFKLHIIICLIFFLINFRYLKEISFKLEIFIFLLVLISIFFFLAGNLKLEWDGHHWIEKTFIFFNNSNIQELKNVQTHPYYPHVGTYIWGYFWKNSLLELEYFGRYFQVYFYILSIFTCFNVLKTKNIIFKILLILFFILITFEPYLLQGYQEYLIFSSLLVASRYILLIDFKIKNNYKLTFLILLIFYTLAWFKDEGSIYYLIFSFSLIFFLRDSFKKKILFFIFLLSLFLLQYLLQKYLIGIYGFPEKTSFLSVFSDVMNVEILITKTFNIVLHILIAFIKYPMWLLIIISLFVIIFIFKENDKIIYYYLCCLTLNISFVFIVFFTFANFDLMLKVSLDRILFQTSGFYTIIIIMFLNKFKSLKTVNFY
jgi:hypothetical protein